MEFILIDGSYFIYHRYYSLKNWWNNARRETETNIPFDNERFVEKYKTTFIKKIKEISQMYAKTKNPIILAGKDCNSKDIWRRKHFNEYKHGRKKDDSGVKDSFVFVSIHHVSNLTTKSHSKFPCVSSLHDFTFRLFAHNPSREIGRTKLRLGMSWRHVDNQTFQFTAGNPL